MSNCSALAALVGVVLVASTCRDAEAQPLSIHDVQFTTDPEGHSPYDGQVVDCVGGVVVHKFPGTQPRVIVQDPDCPGPWCAIQVKDWTITGLYPNVQVGDRVEFTNVLVEEYRGLTLLQWQTAYSPGFVVLGQGYALPDPVLLTAADLGSPPDPANHAVTEPYESMLVTLRDVTVGAIGLGKAGDNYELVQPGGVAWGSDYMNADAGGPYDPRIIPGARLAGITGIVEQYTRYEWDYYQLLTRSAADIVPARVPAVSDWGMILMALATLVAGTLMIRRERVQLVVAILAFGATIPVSPAVAEPLTIRQVQYTDDPDGGSDYAGQVIDCQGGIVVSKYRGTRPRVTLQDPDEPTGWGGIQVKDWTTPTQLFDHVDLGDWVEVTNVLVEEFYGTTFLQWQLAHNPGFTVTSRGNPLPPPLIVPVADVRAPLEHPYDEWWVQNHDAELYESMRLVVRDVTVTGKNLGSHSDNYNLRTPQEHDCWAADYMNKDKGEWGYHPFVVEDQHFCAVLGLLEQYTVIVPEWEHWDYYQFLTLQTASLAICGDGDSDGGVDLADWPRFGECITGPICDSEPGGCNPPAWAGIPLELGLEHCLMMDQDYDGDVDLRDVGAFCGRFVTP